VQQLALLRLTLDIAACCDRVAVPTLISGATLAPVTTTSPKLSRGSTRRVLLLVALLACGGGTDPNDGIDQSWTIRGSIPVIHDVPDQTIADTTITRMSDSLSASST
jgi:hypothetical protein